MGEAFGLKCRFWRMRLLRPVYYTRNCHPSGAQEIRDGVRTRIRFNIVAETGVPEFIPQGEPGA